MSLSLPQREVMVVAIRATPNKAMCEVDVADEHGARIETFVVMLGDVELYQRFRLSRELHKLGAQAVADAFNGRNP